MSISVIRHAMILLELFPCNQSLLFPSSSNLGSGKTSPSSGEPPVTHEANKDVHSQVPAEPDVLTIQNPHILPGTGIAPYQQQQVPAVPFRTPSPQFQSQGVTASLQLPMPLPMGGSNQMQQQVRSVHAVSSSTAARQDTSGSRLQFCPTNLY